MNIKNRSPHQSQEPVSRLYKYKVALLIDDNYIDNFISEQMLAACNFSKETHIAINGQIALDLILQLISEDKNTDQLYPDIIFIDLNMPVMDGVEFIRQFHKLENHLLKRCKLVVLTSSIHDTDKSEVQKIDDSIVFLHKPLTAKMLDTL